MKFFRPTESTHFHVDYSWFEKNGQDINILINKCLTPEQQERLVDVALNEPLDVVDEHTGEVQRVTRAVQFIREERAGDPEFIGVKTPVAEAVFRIFLLNNNQPLTAAELAARINRRPAEILAQLGGRVVYNGIRAVSE
jgi:hypothetical protein